MEKTNSMDIKVKNRYGMLAAGMLVQLCAGIIYMWSVFKGPVSQHLEWDPAKAALTSSIMLAVFVLGIILGGRAQDKIGPKIVTTAGSIMLSLGIILTAMVTKEIPWLVYITYGIIGGFGVGTVYTATVSVIQKWFPDKRGFATGFMVAAFGFPRYLCPDYQLPAVSVRRSHNLCCLRYHLFIGLLTQFLAY